MSKRVTCIGKYLVYRASHYPKSWVVATAGRHTVISKHWGYDLAIAAAMRYRETDGAWKEEKNKCQPVMRTTAS